MCHCMIETTFCGLAIAYDPDDKHQKGLVRISDATNDFDDRFNVKYMETASLTSSDQVCYLCCSCHQQLQDRF